MDNKSRIKTDISQIRWKMNLKSAEKSSIMNKISLNPIDK